jgi:hypothetical protein
MSKFRGIVLMLVPRRRTRDFLKRIVFARYGQSSGAATPWSRRLLMVITTWRLFWTTLLLGSQSIRFPLDFLWRGRRDGLPFRAGRGHKIPVRQRFQELHDLVLFGMGQAEVANLPA